MGTIKADLQTAEDQKFEAERKQRIRDEAEATNPDLADALDDSFPASDPPSMTQPKTRPGAPKPVETMPSGRRFGR
jgi:hypothetical protein